MFGRHGTIVKTSRPVDGCEGNWIHLRYSTTIHVQQALQRHGEMVGKCFIGVIQSPKVSYGAFNPKEYCEDLLDVPIENVKRHNVTYVEPKPRAITQMRSLAAEMPPSLTSGKSFMERFFG
uniref:Nucleoporin NUP35 n=1 Tax=Panagrolaimus sp. ES5 TaxID=591445 RepID=A0AC34GA27_9BILA